MERQRMTIEDFHNKLATVEQELRRDIQEAPANSNATTDTPISLPHGENSEECPASCLEHCAQNLKRTANGLHRERFAIQANSRSPNAGKEQWCLKCAGMLLRSSTRVGRLALAV
jgi:hypothetical protein